MLYLKTVRTGEDNIVAVSPIGNCYVLHKPGSSLFDYKVDEGEADPREHYAIITFDSTDNDLGSKTLGAGHDVDHYIIHENGSTFQKL